MLAFTDKCDGEETGGLVAAVVVVVVWREEMGGLEGCMPDSSAFDVCIWFNVEGGEADIKLKSLIFSVHMYTCTCSNIQ